MKLTQSAIKAAITSFIKALSLCCGITSKYTSSSKIVEHISVSNFLGRPMITINIK